jgi:diaminopimelate epimerase
MPRLPVIRRAMRDRTQQNGLPFMKMHGLGNDFVVIDARARAAELTDAQVRAIADRHRGVGFDQLAVITNPEAPHLTFYNSDGSTSAACGNATRCIARHLMDEDGTDRIDLTTDHGTLHALDAGDGLTSVNMGQPVMDWRAIPLAREVDVDALPLEGSPVATSMGNPHCTYFVDDAEAVDLAARGAAVEVDPLFPQRTNVQFVSVLAPGHLRVRVWERGVGHTLASGSSSCAVTVAATRCGLVDGAARLTLDGGDLQIRWAQDGVWMTGPTMHVFDGVFTDAFLRGATG